MKSNSHQHYMKVFVEKLIELSVTRYTTNKQQTKKVHGGKYNHLMFRKLKVL